MNYTSDELKHALKRFFQYSAFREGQEAIVSNILHGRDVLAVLPTGAGKSICFQLPALLFPDLTIVISPLISLMKDQIRSLNTSEERALSLDSTMAVNMQSQVLHRIESGEIKILYVSPERLQTPAFQAFSHRAKISFVVVDEAHCVVQWGRHFRKEYYQIPEFVNSLDQRPVVAAFTATATAAVRGEIIRHLDLRNPGEFVAGFDRPNLNFQVRRCGNKDLSVLKFLYQHPNQKGIIYCTTRSQVVALQKILVANGFNSRRYHGGLTPLEREQNQNAFLQDRADIMVATNAFGMGIDKKDVRFILHYSMPLNLEGYYQEAGRAGRDGLSSECVLLYNPLDVEICHNLILTSASENHVYEEELLQRMKEYCYLRKGYREFILEYFQ